MPVGPRRPGVARAARCAGPALLVLESVLVVTGRLSLGTAAVIFVVLETSLGLIAVGQLAGGVRRYRQRRAGGADRESAVLNALAAVLPGPVAFLVRHELLAWSSMVLLLRRRKHGVSPGAVQVSYDAALRPLGLVLVGLSVVELVVFELVVPWQPVRLALLVLGVWTLLFVLGLVAANIVRPHVITDDELLLRFGTFRRRSLWTESPRPTPVAAMLPTARRWSSKTHWS